MHSDIPELLQRIAYVVVRSYTVSRYVAMVAAGAKPCRTMQLGLPFASCPGWETIKAAAVLLAVVVAAEYKTNDHFVRRRRGSRLSMAVPTRMSITGSESKVRLQLVNVK